MAKEITENATDMMLDEFYELAKTGGQLEACHDIFKILESEKEPEVIKQLLEKYFDNVSTKFKKLNTKFKLKV